MDSMPAAQLFGDHGAADDEVEYADDEEDLRDLDDDVPEPPGFGGEEDAGVEPLNRVDLFIPNWPNLLKFAEIGRNMATLTCTS